MKNVDDQHRDARAWASSIGSDCVDIVDRGDGSLTKRNLKAPLSESAREKLRRLLDRLR